VSDARPDSGQSMDARGASCADPLHRPPTIRERERTDADTGPSIFLRRLELAGVQPPEALICTPTYLDRHRARQRRGRFLVARVGGVWGHTLSGPNLHGLLRKRYPSLTALGAVWRRLPRCPGPPSLALTRLLNRHKAWLIRAADAVVFQSALSQEMHGAFLRHAPVRVPCTVIPNAVDLAEFHPGAGPRLTGSPALIVSSAVLRLHKRPHDAIRLVNHLVRRHPGIRLHVLGDWDPLVFDLLAHLDTSRCVFHQRVTPGDLPRLYAGADLMLALGIFDACPNVVCEGLASGLPVVTPVESGAAELIGEPNRHWTVREHLRVEEYRSWFVASEIPALPVEAYAAVVETVLDDLPAEKARARARAEAALDIRVTAARYAGFIEDALAASRR